MALKRNYIPKGNMDKLTPIELEDGTIIYTEATENVDTSNINTEANESEERG